MYKRWAFKKGAFSPLFVLQCFLERGFLLEIPESQEIESREVVLETETKEEERDVQKYSEKSKTFRKRFRDA